MIQTNEKKLLFFKKYSSMVLPLHKYIFLHSILWRALNLRWVDLLNREHCDNSFKYYALPFIDSNGNLKKENSSFQEQIAFITL